jgi:hypothetical protein
MVVVVLNMSAARSATLDIDVSTCGRIAARRVFSYAGRPTGLAPIESGGAAPTALAATVLPYSVSVFDVDVTPP